MLDQPQLPLNFLHDIFFDHVFVTAPSAFFQCLCWEGRGLSLVYSTAIDKSDTLRSACCFQPLPLFPHLFVFNLSSNAEEDIVLQTNKQIYSQLLRATANRNSTLLERIEVVICLLEQLASGSSRSSGSAVP
jgi:hypothetical protein